MGASALALVIWWSVFIVGMGVILILLARRCVHQWEIENKDQVDVENDAGRVVRRYTRYVQRCTKCGKLKVWKP